MDMSEKTREPDAIEDFGLEVEVQVLSDSYYAWSDQRFDKKRER